MYMRVVPQSLHTVQYVYKDCMCFVSVHAQTLNKNPNTKQDIIIEKKHPYDCFQHVVAFSNHG